MCWCSPKTIFVCLNFSVGGPISCGGNRFDVAEVNWNVTSSSTNISRSATFSEIKLADHEFNRTDRVDILIASDIYPSVMLKGVRKNLFLSFFGWVLTVSLPEPRSQSRTTLVLYCTELELDKQLDRFWKPPRRSKMSPDDEYCEEYFRKTVHRNSAGRYIVSLPIKP